MSTCPPIFFPPTLTPPVIEFDSLVPVVCVLLLFCVSDVPLLYELLEVSVFVVLLESVVLEPDESVLVVLLESVSVLLSDSVVPC